MNVVADNYIPLVEYFFSSFGNVTLLPANDINLDAVKHADILLTRSTVKITQALVTSSSLKFVGSCVTGVDHIDPALLSSSSKPFVYAAQGCNQQAVLSYVQHIVLRLLVQNKLPRQGKAAVIGVGRIGRLVVSFLKWLGFDVLTCDPYQKKAPGFVHTALETINNMDLVCVHPNLISEGSYPSQGLITLDFLTRQKRSCWLVNASRGQVIEPETIKQAPVNLCLDVWPNERDFQSEWLSNVAIATPHIAGHTALGLSQGTSWAYHACCRHFGRSEKKQLPFVYQNNRHANLFAVSADFKAQMRHNTDFASVRKRYGAERLRAVCRPV